ncbi:hypothetical protein B0H14DRAFT_3695149 [Mycena olivaceomarginata]|nr:hypothetical protein B0H14DRAFT_3695149 [Mycena olivaceomarginata]
MAVTEHAAAIGDVTNELALAGMANTAQETPPCPSKQQTRVFSCIFAKLACMLKSGSDTASVAEKSLPACTYFRALILLFFSLFFAYGDAAPHDADLDGDVYAQRYATSAESPNTQRTGHISSPTILSDGTLPPSSTSTTPSAAPKIPVSLACAPKLASFPAVEDKAKGGGGEYFPSGSKAERRISFFAQSLTVELPAMIPVLHSRFPYSTPIDPPTISVVVHPNSSPLGGMEGTKHMLTSHTHGAPPSPPKPLPFPSPPPQSVSHALHSLPLLSHPLPPV